MSRFTLNIETDDPGLIASVAYAMAGKNVTGEVAGKAATPTKAGAAKPDTGAATTVAGAAIGPTATTAASPSDAQNIPSDGDLMAAANEAVAKLGAGGQAKIKPWISTNFQKDDGTPGTLKQLKDSQKADLLAKLKQIAAGTLTV